MPETYSNKDFYLSAFLIASDFPLAGHYREGPITIFLFNCSDELKEAIKNYYDRKTMVEPIKYGQSFRMLKSVLHNSPESNSYKGKVTNVKQKEGKPTANNI